MGEIKFAIKQIKKDLWFIGDILIFALGIYFIVQSVNNIEFFNYMYLRPIINFINEHIIPFFAA